MSKDTKQALVSRLKSLAWRVGGMALAMVLAFISDNIGLLELPPLYVTLIGLVIGEVTKFLNSRTA